MGTITDALKEAVRLDGRTHYELAKTGLVSEGVMSRFVRNERTLTLHTADRLCEALGVECRLVRRRAKRDR